MQQIASQNAPSPSVVIPHFIFGGITWLVVTILIAFFPEALTQHYFNPKLLSITHLLVLGWISMVIFGALYQLIPVIMEVKLFSEKLAFASFGLLASGSILLAVSFWNLTLNTIMHIAASLLLLSVFLFAINVLTTASVSKKNSIEKRFIISAVIWLLFTVIAGVALAINLKHPFLSTPNLELLKLHAHAGIVGWFVQLIIGVGSRLLPMFMVAHNLNFKKLEIAHYLINIGLALAMVALIFGWSIALPVAIIAVVTGIMLFLSFLIEAYKKRVKKQFDIGMNQSALAFLVLLFPLMIVIALLFIQKENLTVILPLSIIYGSTLLIGFISSLIMGQTYKTLPFIIWLSTYKGKIGKGKIPFPKELYSEKVAKIQVWSFALGFLVLLIGVAYYNYFVQLGAIILFISVLMYNINILKIILHTPKFDG